MRRLPAAVILALTTSLALAGCGGSSSGSNGSTSQPSATATETPPTTAPSPTANATAPADPAAATAQIKTAYSQFFSSPIPKAKTLLEDGSSLSAAFKIAAKAKGTAKERAQVFGVSYTNATSAMVKYQLATEAPGAKKYTVLLGNMKDASGKVQYADGAAVFANGKWVVAKVTFCGLVTLINGKTPPGC